MRTFWIDRKAKIIHMDNEESNQTARICRLVWVFVGAHVGRHVSHAVAYK